MANMTCPVCTVPVEAADRFCCETGTCPARGYRPDSAQTRAVVADLERRPRRTPGGFGARAMEAPADDYLTSYERGMAQVEAEAGYRDAYDQAKMDAELFRAYMRVGFHAREGS